MASKKKNHYYVLVMTDAGPKFVTKINYSNKTAEWNTDDAPLEMGKYQAEDLVLGLNLNFNQAYMICHPITLESHPYRYDAYHIKWEENEYTEGEED
jgi:hypothetical protein